MSLTGVRRSVCLIPKFALCMGRSLTVPTFSNRRHLHKYMHVQRFSSSIPASKKETICMYFLDRDGDRIEVRAAVGSNLLDVAIDNDIDLEGACEGTLACSTCHLIFKTDNYEKIPEKPTDEELDMLDLAFGLTDTSRLGCQVIVTKDMDGWEIQVPSGVADAREP